MSSNSSKDLLNVSGQKPGVQSVMKTLQKDLATGGQQLPKSCHALESVKAFLPQIAAANKELESQMAERAAEDFDIENVDEEDGPVVEMDLALVELGEDSDSDSDSDSSSSDSSSEDEDSKKHLITILQSMGSEERISKEENGEAEAMDGNETQST